jgi:four helix bundle protein
VLERIQSCAMARKQARRKHERSFTRAFQVEELSLELIEALVPLMPRIKQGDKALEDQLRRAASRMGPNCAEAAFSDPGNRRARLFTAAGSAGETQHALRQAVAWRYVTVGEAECATALVRRIVAMLWKMTARRLDKRPVFRCPGHSTSVHGVVHGRRGSAPGLGAGVRPAGDLAHLTSIDAVNARSKLLVAYEATGFGACARTRCRLQPIGRDLFAAQSVSRLLPNQVNTCP